jgi:hypothetical protein
MKNILLIILGLTLCSCTDEDATIRTLSNSGYTQITTEGYAFFGCGEDDTYATAFTAKNPHGDTVSGVVCCGLLKSCTVRF